MNKRQRKKQRRTRIVEFLKDGTRRNRLHSRFRDGLDVGQPFMIASCFAVNPITVTL